MIRDYKLPFEMLPNLLASKLTKKNKFEYWNSRHHHFWKNQGKSYISNYFIRIAKKNFFDNFDWNLQNSEYLGN